MNKYLAILVAALVLLASCRSTVTDETTVNTGSQRDNLENSINDNQASAQFLDDRTNTEKLYRENLAKWQSHNLESYKISFQRSCFCPQEYLQPMTIEVKDALVTSAMTKDNRKVKNEVMESVNSVSQVFAQIEKALSKSELIEVTYDQQYGYPSQVFIDHSKRMADEEVRISFKELIF